MFVRGINGNLNRNFLFFFLSSNFSRKNGFHSLVAVADPGEGARGGRGGVGIPLFSDQINHSDPKVRGGGLIFLDHPPLSWGLDDRYPPPLI